MRGFIVAAANCFAMDAGGRRVERLRDTLKEQGFQGALIIEGLNRRYLSGFTGTGGWLLVTLHEQFLLTDSRYWEQAEQEAPGWELVKVSNEKGGSIGGLKELVQSIEGCQRIAFEADAMTVALLDSLNGNLDFCLIEPCCRLVESIRATKDEGEIDLMRQAARRCRDAFLLVQDCIRPGMTEREIIVELDCALLRAGISIGSFGTIVASGPNASRPHSRGTDRPVQKGDMLLVDFGGTFRGYHADMTRTIPLGNVDGKLLEIYRIVRAAQERAIAAARPGITCDELDMAARQVIIDAEYGENFGHSLGHGLGLAIHEEPSIRKGNPSILESGMVFTIEPGIYLPGIGGVRIEDMVLLQDDGAHLLTDLPYSLLL